MLASITAMLLSSAAAVTPAAEPLATDPQQSSTDQPALGTPQPGEGNDIVVTAQRRSETIQNVPIAISVVGGEVAAQTGTYNVNRLVQLTPTLQFYSTNPRNSGANIRGLGAPFGLTNDGIEQGVGIYVDQVYYARIASASFDFNDVDRIEILRGPQGTLYGKNTTAGAINIVTRKPSFTPEARFEVTGGNYDFFQGKGSVSGPLIDDVLAARLSVSYTSRRGTIYNTTRNEWQNSQDNLSLRGQVLWRATPNLDITFAGDFNHQDPKCCVQYYARVGTTQRAITRQYAALAAAQGYAVPSTNPFDRVTDLDTAAQAKQSIGGASVVANWNLGGSTLTSVSAYRFWDWVPSSDRDFIGLPVTTVSANRSQQYQVSQEVRLASNGKRPLDYVVGAFYFYQSIDTQGLQVQGPAASRYLLSGANASNPAVLNGLTSTNTIGFKNTSAAVFGKLTWHATDRLSLSGGIRVNYDEKNASYVSVVTTGTGAVLNCSVAAQAGSTVVRDQCTTLTPQSYTPRFKNWNVSGDATLAYRIGDDVNAYFTYARSYKSGGINLNGLPLDANNLPILSAATVKPEEVSHFEVGLKTRLFDHTATFNLAAFWTDIYDYQATVTNGQLGILRGYLANAGQARTRGVEFDAAWRPTSRFSLYGNGAYTDAKYVRFVDAPCPPELSGGTTVSGAQTPGPAGVPGSLSPQNCNISGQELPGISKWSFAFGAEYDLPAKIFGARGNFYLGYDGSYRSRFSSNPSPSIYTYVDGYALSNFRLGFKTESRLNAFAWVRNAFDQNYFDLLALQSGNTGLIVGQPGDPRTYGITISKSF